jgi:hypothetical protein
MVLLILQENYALSLSALCVEVNSRRSTPWVMPKTIHEILEKLHAVNIQSSAQFATYLISDVTMTSLNENIASQGYLPFHVDTLKLFREVLRLPGTSL